jgi:hypothetical protein
MHAAEDSHSPKLFERTRIPFSQMKPDIFFTMTNQPGETEYARIMHVFYCGAGLFFLSLHVSRAAHSADERASFCRKKSTSHATAQWGFFYQIMNEMGRIWWQTESENFAVLLLAAIVCVSVSATRSCLKFCNITFQQTSATAPAAYMPRHDRVSTRY